MIVQNIRYPENLTALSLLAFPEPILPCDHTESKDVERVAGCQQYLFVALGGNNEGNGVVGWGLC